MCLNPFKNEKAFPLPPSPFQPKPAQLSFSPSSFLFFSAARFPHAPAHLAAQPAPRFPFLFSHRRMGPARRMLRLPRVVPRKDSPRVRFRAAVFPGPARPGATPAPIKATPRPPGTLNPQPSLRPRKTLDAAAAIVELRPSSNSAAAPPFRHISAVFKPSRSSAPR